MLYNGMSYMEFLFQLRQQFSSYIGLFHHFIISLEISFPDTLVHIIFRTANASTMTLVAICFITSR